MKKNPPAPNWPSVRCYIAYQAERTRFFADTFRRSRANCMAAAVGLHGVPFDSLQFFAVRLVPDRRRKRKTKKAKKAKRRSRR